MGNITIIERSDGDNDEWSNTDYTVHENGQLVIYNENSQIAAIYSPTSWLLVYNTLRATPERKQQS